MLKWKEQARYFCTILKRVRAFKCWEILYTLWLFNIAMENGPFIVDFPIKTSIYEGFSMAMLVITRW